MSNKVFSYDNNPITFQLGEATMVNATEMAKPFGKLVKVTGVHQSLCRKRLRYGLRLCSKGG